MTEEEHRHHFVFRFTKEGKQEAEKAHAEELTKEQLLESIDTKFDSVLLDVTPVKGMKMIHYPIDYSLVQGWKDRPARKDFPKVPSPDDVQAVVSSKGQTKIVSLRLQYGEQDPYVYELYMSNNPKLVVWTMGWREQNPPSYDANKTTLEFFNTVLEKAQNPPQK